MQACIQKWQKHYYSFFSAPWHTSKWYWDTSGTLSYLSSQEEGHSITKHTGGWLEGLSQNLQNIYPKIAILKKCQNHPLNILKEHSVRWKISNMGQIFISLRIVPLIILMNHFSYPQLLSKWVFLKNPEKSFSQTKSQTSNYWASPPVLFTLPFLDLCLSQMLKTTLHMET